MVNAFQWKREHHEERNKNSQINTVVLGALSPTVPSSLLLPLHRYCQFTLDKAPPQRQKRGGVREREGGLLPTHSTPLFLILFLHSVVSSRCRELSAVFEQVLHDFSLLVIVYVRLSPLSGGVVVTGIVRVSGRFVCSCFIVLCSTVIGWFLISLSVGLVGSPQSQRSTR